MLGKYFLLLSTPKIYKSLMFWVLTFNILDSTYIILNAYLQDFKNI